MHKTRYISDISFMGIEYIIAFLKEVFHTPNDGLRVKIAVEALLEAKTSILILQNHEFIKQPMS